MKIVFLHTQGVPLYPSILNQRPLGGTESGIVYLAEALRSLGHWVAILSPVENPPLAEVLYLPLRAMQDLGPVDLLVVVRDWQGLLMPIQAKMKFLWTGDSYDQLATIGIGDPRVASSMTALLAVSEWQRKRLAETSGFPLERIQVLGNGVALSLFSGTELRNRKRLIYTSTPNRGLKLLLPVIKELHHKHPDVELHIFSSFDVYRGAGPLPNSAAQYDDLLRQLRKAPGVIVHGSVIQSTLARELMRSSVFAYPNIFEETCCIAAMEAMAAGCAIVTSAYGALPETVGDAGILITQAPGSPAYLREFIDAIDQLLGNETLLTSLAERGRKRAQNLDWSTTAERLLQFAANYTHQLRRT